MSKFFDEIYKVIEIFHEMLGHEFDLRNEGETININDLYPFFTEAIKKTAEFFGVEEGTIYDKCTRQLAISFPEFCKNVIDHISGVNTKLEDLIIDNMKNTDNPADIKAALQKYIP